MAGDPVAAEKQLLDVLLAFQILSMSFAHRCVAFSIKAEAGLPDGMWAQLVPDSVFLAPIHEAKRAAEASPGS